MSQIEINILKEATPPSKKVLSCSFFKMQGAYRDISIYKSYLEGLITRKSKILKGFELRVYTDDSGKDFVLDLAKDEDHVSVYHYNCPAFKEGDGHTGTFGTLVRFLPLFEPGLEIVWITDIDIQAPILSPDTIQTMKRLNRDFYMNTHICYNRKPWNQGIKYPIVAYKIISFITLPRQLLTRFITKLTNGEFSDVIDEINGYNDRKTPNKKFPYGMDEYFINNVVHKYIKTHNISIYLMVGYSVINILLNESKQLTYKEKTLMQNFSKQPRKDDFPKIKQLIKKLIPPVLEKYPCLQEMLDKIDSLPFPTKVGWLLEEYRSDVKTLNE